MRGAAEAGGGKRGKQTNPPGAWRLRIGPGRPAGADRMKRTNPPGRAKAPGEMPCRASAREANKSAPALVCDRSAGRGGAAASWAVG